MAITIKYFGAIEEVTGRSEEQFSEQQFDTLDAIKSHVLAKYKSIGELSFQLAVNQSLTESATLGDGDEVAFLPPFAGG